MFFKLLCLWLLGLQERLPAWAASGLLGDLGQSLCLRSTWETDRRNQGKGWGGGQALEIRERLAFHLSSRHQHISGDSWDLAIPKRSSSRFLSICEITNFYVQPKPCLTEHCQAGLGDFGEPLWTRCRAPAAWAALHRPLGCSINLGSLLWVSLQEEQSYFGVYMKAPDCWKLPFEPLLEWE